MLLVIVSTIVSLIVIAIISVFLFFSIQKITKESSEIIRHNTSKVVYNYDEVLEAKRKELKELEAQNINKKVYDDEKYKKQELYTQTITLNKQNTLSAAEIYKTIRNNFDLDYIQIIEDLQNKKINHEGNIKILNGIIKKINKETFARLDTLSKEQQLNLLSEVLNAKEMNEIKKLGSYGIKLYNKIEKLIILSHDNFKIFVANQKMQDEIKQKLNLDSIVNDDIVEGINIIDNGILYKYSIERSEIQ